MWNLKNKANYEYNYKKTALTDVENKQVATSGGEENMEQ